MIVPLCIYRFVRWRVDRWTSWTVAQKNRSGSGSGFEFYGGGVGALAPEGLKEGGGNDPEGEC